MNDDVSPSPAVKTLHGAKVAVPQAWDDFSVFRFAAPRIEEKPGRFLGEVAQLQPNLIAIRKAIPAGTRLSEVFLDSNVEFAEQNPSFKVLGQGQGRYHEQRCSWQDSEHLPADLQMKAFQRHVALATEDDEQIVLLTLTGVKADVLHMSEQMGLVFK